MTDPPMPPPTSSGSPVQPSARLLEKLCREIPQTVVLAGASRKPSTQRTGFARLLPGGELRPPVLVDLLAEHAGSGAGLVGWWLAGQAIQKAGDGKQLVVIDPWRRFYPPAALGWAPSGFDPRQLLVVHPASQRDAIWAMLAALRSSAVAAVWASLGRIDERSFRRLQLAAEAGQALGVLVRPAHFAGGASWADVQIGCRRPATLLSDAEAQAMRVACTVVRNRHGPAGAEAHVGIDWRQGCLSDISNERADHDGSSKLHSPKQRVEQRFAS